MVGYGPNQDSTAYWIQPVDSIAHPVHKGKRFPQEGPEKVWSAWKVHPTVLDKFLRKFCFLYRCSERI
ncbi:hypothetical protein Y1Q_0007954 [Alligator mississippiensis]|uniref:Uncharacterized protein n=1 Tax=Alligator mississippiensis TaxID=8496 RepID=A0A151NEX7_ALLMI|nr:hypothetical protein Y1Q_0007954 [Alligator mississippiensis]